MSAAIYWKQIKPSLTNQEQNPNSAQYGIRTYVQDVHSAISTAQMLQYPDRKMVILMLKSRHARDAESATENAGSEQ